MKKGYTRLKLKQLISALLTAVLLLQAGAAFALTGEEALGLTGNNNTGVSSAGSYPSLSLGSRDGDDAMPYVVMLQNRLYELGYLSSAADGQYGQQTETAVLKFQENNGLTPTGIADDPTQIALYSPDATRAPEAPSVDGSVKMVQIMLGQWGFLQGKADGIAGTGTATAVAEFKNYIYNTYSHLYGAYATPSPVPAATLAPGEEAIAIDEPISASTEVSVNGQNGEIDEGILKFTTGEQIFQVYQMDVASGSEGMEVWRIQRRLHNLNYLYKPDGAFGGLTELALKYFQKKNGLPETGIADRATQEKLFSSAALSAEEYVFPYKIGVSLEKQRVYVWMWNGSNYNTELKSFKCSTGVDESPTPTGIYQSGGKVTSGKWYYFADYNCYAKYAYRIVGGILFHSVLYNSDKSGPTNSSVRALGRKASHGCIRLAEENALWIFQNCPEGTTIIIK